MPSRADSNWVLHLDLMAEVLPDSKEGWVKLVITRDVAKELYQDLKGKFE